MLISQVPIAKNTEERGGNHSFWEALFRQASKADGLQPEMACVLSLILGGRAVFRAPSPIGIFIFRSTKGLDSLNGGKLELSGP